MFVPFDLERQDNTRGERYISRGSTVLRRKVAPVAGPKRSPILGFLSIFAHTL